MNGTTGEQRQPIVVQIHLTQGGQEYAPPTLQRTQRLAAVPGGAAEQTSRDVKAVRILNTAGREEADGSRTVVVSLLPSGHCACACGQTSCAGSGSGE
jgi:hypothetical protein